MKVGDLVECLHFGFFQGSPIVVIIEYQGKTLLGNYWKVSDGSSSWYYREEDMELLNESR